MHDSSMYRMGGLGFIVAGVFLAVALFVQPQPREFSEATTALALTNWLIPLAYAAVVTGVLAFARQCTATAAEGWGMAAVGTIVVGTAGFLAARMNLLDAVVAYGQAGMPAGTAGQALAVGGVAWLTGFCMGLAMLRLQRYPGWLGPTWMAVALALVLVRFTPLVADAGVMRWLSLAGVALLTVTGAAMLRLARSAAAPAGADAPVPDAYA